MQRANEIKDFSSQQGVPPKIFVVCCVYVRPSKETNDRMGLRRRLRPANLAKKLLRIREALRLSQTQLLRRLDANELMHYGRISEYERGTREPSLWVLLAYARVAGVHLEDLVDDNIDLPAKLPGDVIYPARGTRPASRRK